MNYPINLFEKCIDSKTELSLQMKAISLGDSVFKCQINGKQFNQFITQFKQTLDDCLCSGDEYYLIKAQCFYFYFTQAISFNVEVNHSNPLKFKNTYNHLYKRLHSSDAAIFLTALIEEILPPDDCDNVREFFDKKIKTNVNNLAFDINPSNLNDLKKYCYFYLVGEHLLFGQDEQSKSLYFFNQPQHLEQKLLTFKNTQQLLDPIFNMFKEKKQFETILECEAGDSKKMKI